MISHTMGRDTSGVCRVSRYLYRELRLWPPDYSRETLTIYSSARREFVCVRKTKPYSYIH